MTDTPAEDTVQIPDAIVIQSLRQQLSDALSQVSDLRIANEFLSALVTQLSQQQQQEEEAPVAPEGE